MGYYVQTPGHNHFKAELIAKMHGGQIVDKPATFDDIPAGKALIVVVDNGAFEAAALAYSEREFEEFTDPKDERFKLYVLLNEDVAFNLAGFRKR